MLPSGHRPLVVADTRRAAEWEAGLRRAGFDVVLRETPPGDDRGGWVVGVVAAQEHEAKAFVSEVVRGRARLPAAPLLSPAAWRALAGIALLLAVVAGVISLVQ